MKKVSIVFNFEKEELPEYECELERSKFFGSPVFPKSVIEKGFPEGWVFLCQLKMEDIEFYDESKLLPKKGYLYFFFEDNDRKKIHCIYATDQITDVVENFNEPYDDKDFMTPFYLTFEEREEIVTGEGISFSSQDGTKLLGFPYDNISGHKVDLDEILLFQIDPLSCVDFPFLSNSDGIGYVFIKLDDLKKKNFENIKFLVAKSK